MIAFLKSILLTFDLAKLRSLAIVINHIKLASTQ